MPGSLGPNLGLTWGWVPHEDHWGRDGFNPGFALLDTIVHLTVISRSNTPPGSPTNGVRYIVGAAPTGAWSGHSDAIAVYLTTGTPAWAFIPPKEGWRAWDVARAAYRRFTGAAWVDDNAGLVITAPAAGDVMVWDASALAFINVRPMRGISFGNDPTATLTPDQQVFFHRFAFPFTVPADFGDYREASSTFGGTAEADDDVIFRVQKALAAAPLAFTNVATITVGGGTVDATFDSSATDLNFDKRDVMCILGPTVPDGGFKGALGTIVGYETAP